MTWGKTILLLGVLVILGSVSDPTGVFALTFTPDKFVSEVYPGVPLTEELTLLNETGETISVALDPVSLNLDNAALGQATFLLDTVGSSETDWISVSPNRLVLEPGEARSLDVRLLAPVSSPASLTAGIATTFRPVRSDEQTGAVSIETVTGPLIFAEVITDDRSVDGFISSIETTGGSRWFSHLPVTFAVSFANNGTVHLIPSGYLEVRDVFGRLIERVDMNEGQQIVLPNTTRVFNSSWDTRTEERASALRAELVRPLVGPFKVTATMTYDEQTADSTQMTVWMFPWRLGCLLGAILLGVAAARRRLRRV